MKKFRKVEEMPMPPRDPRARPIFLVDIDGTLADITHRLHFIEKSAERVQDWDGFFAACGKDDPIGEVIDTIRLLKKGGAVIIMVSGRSETVRDETLAWFTKYKIPCDALFMRDAGDHRQDAIIKGEFLDDIQRRWKGWNILGVFEDRQQCVAMYRERGLQVFQVADGNF